MQINQVRNLAPQMSLTPETLAVKNAGLVLLNNYLPMLFERLGLLIENKVFTGLASQCKAVQYAEFAVTGLSATSETILQLNKVLCGLPLAQPVPEEIDISEDQILLINGLLQAMIGYWPATGSSSVEGFRGNWLVREGLLRELEAYWELVVEKRAYDLLLNQSPFTFSVIKYPWMPKPLHVTWL
ncbi:hypothetical protein DBR40_02835 [Pedobacter sp. KBW01]|uniref:contractile injection system tape measure protein n=2 Tax=unclassified Pedobacter TaxID=2628915 RepID=UPI000F5B3BFB|nr:contractile injection system tape measure protein [Pedobacter sp. KBW01]RQO79314.1 hypothetical protein DBR40_02835 [Pedobacter sp. KBW01]